MNRRKFLGGTLAGALALVLPEFPWSKPTRKTTATVAVKVVADTQGCVAALKTVSGELGKTRIVGLGVWWGIGLTEENRRLICGSVPHNARKVRICERNTDFVKVFWRTDGETVHAIPYRDGASVGFIIQGKNKRHTDELDQS